MRTWSQWQRATLLQSSRPSPRDRTRLVAGLRAVRSRTRWRGSCTRRARSCRGCCSSTRQRRSAIRKRRCRNLFCCNGLSTICRSPVVRWKASMTPSSPHCPSPPASARRCSSLTPTPAWLRRSWHQSIRSSSAWWDRLPTTNPPRSTYPCPRHLCVPRRRLSWSTWTATMMSPSHAMTGDGTSGCRVQSRR